MCEIWQIYQTSLTWLQTRPDGQRNESLHLIPTQFHLHAVEAVIQKSNQRRLFVQIPGRQWCVRLQTCVEHLLKEVRKPSIRAVERCPGVDAFAELLVQHHHDRHDVGVRGRLRRIVGPQILFEILAELEHHDATRGIVGLFDIFVVDVIDDRRIVRQMGAGRVWRPVLVAELKKNNAI